MDISVTPTRAAQVNKILRELGVKEYLTRGRGYWYFAGGDWANWFTSSVPVYRITSGSICWWLTQWLLLASKDSKYAVKLSVVGGWRCADGHWPITFATDSCPSVAEFNDLTEAIRWLLANR